MSPQFVDFDQDGRVDIVAGTFDGSPHVAFAGADGFQQPEQILDKDGRRIVLNQFWNFESKEWDSTRRFDPPGLEGEGHGTSAWAVDWDGDSDLDLLLGDYDGGRLFLRKNESGGAGRSFATSNEPVFAGGSVLEMPSKLGTVRVIDWDNDGRFDLLLSTMGDAYGDEKGGGVYLCRNRGRRGAPEFDSPEALIPPGAKRGGAVPLRPDSGLYADADDADGDGDLDLIVGGRSHLKPEAPRLDEDRRARLAELRERQKKLTGKLAEMNRVLYANDEGLAGQEFRKAVEQRMGRQRSEREKVEKALAPIREEIERLSPSARQETFVWFYENLAARSER
ncbi:MAG: hypothetical protein Fur0037_19300 [Planctomycetota bacterium]